MTPTHFRPLARAASLAWSPAVLALLLVAATGCGGGGDTVAPPPPPPPPAPVANVQVTPASADLAVGATQQLAATTRDANGNTLSGRTVTWSSSAPGVASISTSGLVTGVAVGNAIITATSEGRSGTATVNVAPPPVASVLVTPATAEVLVGATTQLTATPRDAASNPLTGRTVTWSSSSAAVATVSDAGLVTAVAPGQATINATSEGQTGTATITVIQVPVATVAVTPPTAAVQVGQTQQLTAATLDGQGQPLTGRPVTWSSSAQAVATVSDGGLVTGVAIGSATITATSEGKSGTAQVTVTLAAGAPVITGVTPSTLEPGAVATITGTGFSTIPAENVVTIQGVPMSVTSATATSLSVTVPCVNSGTQVVTITSAGLQGLPVNQPVAATQRTLAVGEAAIISNAAAVGCNELSFGASSGRYLVTVYSVATSPNTLTDFQLAGNPAVAGEPMAMVQPQRQRLLPRLSAQAAQQAEWDRAHLLILEENRRILEEGIARGHASVSSAHLVAAAPSLGDTRTFNFANFGTTSGCLAATESINGKVVYAGTRAIIWEDEANTIQSSTTPTLAAAYQRLGTLYDTEQHDVVKANFGDPLRRDLDGDGRVHMVFSQKVNEGGAFAFVSSCDQFPPATHPRSNFGEFFYSRVPTSAASNPNSTTSVDGWLPFMVRTVIHEVKHIASHAARFANSSPQFEVSWQEEATARHSEELWMRQHIYQVPWKGNTGWGTASTNGVFCDFHLTNATCNSGDPAHRPNYGMYRHFHEFRIRLLEPWNWSPFGDGTGQTGAIFYNVGWSLLRYAIDRYGTSDAQFLTGLNQATTNGVTNLTARAGVSIEELLGGWGLALYASNYPGLNNPSPSLQFPTWDLRSIYAGLNASPSYASQYPSPFLLAPVQLTPGSFSASQTGVRGGAHAYYEFAGVPGGAQLLHLQAIGGGAPSSNLRIAIARLE